MVNLSLPVAILLLVIFVSLGASLTYFGLQETDQIVEPTAVPTATNTATPSPTHTPITPTSTSTLQPTPTPVTYIVQSGDSCSGIAAFFNISIQSIIIENSLPVECILTVNQELKIPHPTPTNTPIATATLSSSEETREACETETYVVQADDTLSMIATVRGIPMEAIQVWNGMVVDTVFEGQIIILPLCEVTFIWGAGTVTPSPAPPYPAPELLLPLDGQAFTLADDTVTLQWSSVGTLRQNEAYQVIVIDVTEGQNKKLVDEVTDTKYIIPESMRPGESKPHVFRWYVVPVAQISVDEEGNPVWVPGGATSATWAFTWSGAVPEE
jgi:LysM repeat protein